MEPYFRFKQFQVRQDRCGMKVGTDGVLLGAWAPLDHQPESILDIGAGTGLIALMLAQRSRAKRIDALEIESQAFAQCVSNFRASPWADRLRGHAGDLKHYMKEAGITYDLLVCNPPFYNEKVNYPNIKRLLARQQYAMPPPLLVRAVSGMLSGKGIFALILPSREEQEFSTLALTHGLYLLRRCQIRGTRKAPVKRCLLAFGRSRPPRVEMELLVIEESRQQYTKEYVDLTRDFYLKF